MISNLIKLSSDSNIIQGFVAAPVRCMFSFMLFCKNILLKTKLFTAIDGQGNFPNVSKLHSQNYFAMNISILSGKRVAVNKNEKHVTNLTIQLLD